MLDTIYRNLIHTYLNMGLAPIPMKFKSKQPSIEGWTTRQIGIQEIEEYFIEPTNIGIVTGKPSWTSWGCIDLDIDDPNALKFAPHLLPETDCIFGRASKPRSHWVYRVRHGGKRLSFSTDHMIVEVRGNGCCTVFPPSVHESGERIEFETPDYFIAAFSTFAELTRAATKIAIATVVHPYWSEESHSRHALALAVAAFLARRGWKAEDVSNLVGAIATEANDDELEDRLRCVDDTFAAYAQGRPITGDNELAGLIGPDLASHIEKWLSGKKPSKEKKKSTTGNSSSSGNGSIDITTDAAAADAFASAFKDRLLYCNAQWFYKEVQVLEPIPVEYIQGLAKHFSRITSGNSQRDLSHCPR